MPQQGVRGWIAGERELVWKSPLSRKTPPVPPFEQTHRKSGVHFTLRFRKNHSVCQSSEPLCSSFFDKTCRRSRTTVRTTTSREPAIPAKKRGTITFAKCRASASIPCYCSCEIAQC